MFINSQFFNQHSKIYLIYNTFSHWKLTPKMIFPQLGFLDNHTSRRLEEDFCIQVISFKALKVINLSQWHIVF
jgi:hypothetical protein